MTRGPAMVALLAALGATGAGLWFGTFAVGGSDSSCYGLMARAVAAGARQPVSALAATAPWPDVPLTVAPAGFIPAPNRPGAASPICAPGFALVAAPLLAAAGPDGLFWLSPIAGGVFVWAVFLIAARLGAGWAGASAALIAAASPVFLYQIVQPMSDVSAAACWAAAAAVLLASERPRPITGGALIGLALLVRPNLLPAGLAALTIVWLEHGRRTAARVAAAMAPFGVLVLVLNAALYGGPLASGYGSASTLFAAAHVPPNLARYGRAILETQWAWPFAAGFAPAVLPAPFRRRAAAVLAAALALAVCYLPYTPFPEWWYLRFLLPALGLSTALASAAAAHGLGRRWPPRTAAAVLMAASLALAGAELATARSRLAFDLPALEARFRLTGEVIRERLPPQTVALSVWTSGSIRFHADREIVMWDALDPAWLDRSVRWLDAAGRSPVVALERWEEPSFRARFAGQAYGALDWPPRFDVDNRVRIWVCSDRASFLAGVPVTTETVWAR